ncbi:MAG: hypothetical protein V3R89_07465 [Thermoanaerobaculia bacterium]
MTTLSFESFWSWLMQHPNCILRAGTPDTVLFDDDELHWHFASDGPILFIQVMQGKRLLGEIVLDPERVAYVQALTEERDGEYGFELISESETERVAAYFFVLSHGFDEELPGDGRAVH